MITIPTYFGTYGIYMVFNLVQWNKYFNPNSDENIQNISQADSIRYINSRTATVIIAISFYIAGRACTINYSDTKESNDFLNDENLLVIEEKDQKETMSRGSFTWAIFSSIIFAACLDSFA